MTKLATPKNMAAWARRYIEVFNLALVSIDPGEKAPKGDDRISPRDVVSSLDEVPAKIDAILAGEVD